VRRGWRSQHPSRILDAVAARGRGIAANTGGLAAAANGRSAGDRRLTAEPRSLTRLPPRFSVAYQMLESSRKPILQAGLHGRVSVPPKSEFLSHSDSTERKVVRFSGWDFEEHRANLVLN
jgi:hypothetical protein